VVTTACPQDDNPLSYDKLDGEWLVWYQVAHRFERKVPSPDRADIRHGIVPGRSSVQIKPFINWDNSNHLSAQSLTSSSPEEYNFLSNRNPSPL
jgi:hypothetical protein